MAKEGELHFTLFFFIYFYFFLVLRVLKTDGYFLGNRNIKYMPKSLIKQPFLLCALNLAGSYSLITLLFLPSLISLFNTSLFLPLTPLLSLSLLPFSPFPSSLLPLSLFSPSSPLSFSNSKEKRIASTSACYTPLSLFLFPPSLSLFPSLPLL